MRFRTHNIHSCYRKSKRYPNYASLLGAIINTHMLELSLSRTNFYGSKGVRATKVLLNYYFFFSFQLTPGRVAQSVGHLTHKSGVLGSIPGLATYFRFSFRFFKKGSCQLLAKVCARSTG